MRLFSSFLEVVGVALVAAGFGMRWLWVGVVVAGVGLLAVGVMLDPPPARARRDE